MSRNNVSIKFALFTVVVLEYLLLVFTFLGNRVKADSFYPEADNFVSEVDFYYGLSFSPRALPLVTYDLEQAVGRNRSDVTAEAMYAEISNPSSSWSERRLVLPPSSDVYLDILGINKTSHMVGVSKFWLFVQRYGVEGVDVLLESSNSIIYRNIALNYQGSLITKGGRSIEFQGLGNIAAVDGAGNVGKKRKEVYVGRVLQPIEVRLDSVSCGVQSRDVVFEVKNNGNAKATIRYKNTILGVKEQTLESSTVTSEVMLETEYDLQEAMFVVEVEESENYCFEDLGRGLFESPLDAHAVLVARNDEGKPLWGGIVASKQIEGNSPRFCIKRMGYSIEIPLEECSLPTNYQIEVSQAFVTLPANTEIRIPFRILNVGGESKNPISLTLAAPEEWKEWLQLKLQESPSIVKEGDEFGLLLDKNTFITGEIIVTSPVLFSHAQSDDFAFRLETQGKSVSIGLHPEISGTFKVVTFEQDCSNENLFRLATYFDSVGLVVNPTIYLSMVGDSSQAEGVEVVVVKKRGEVVFEGGIPAEGVEVEFKGKYYKGSVEFEILHKPPVTGGLRASPAVSGVTAKVRRCIKRTAKKPAVGAIREVFVSSAPVLGVRFPALRNAVQISESIDKLEPTQSVEISLFSWILLLLIILLASVGFLMLKRLFS